MQRSTVVTIVAAVALQGLLLGIALMVGVLRPQGPEVVKLRSSPGSPTAERAAQAQVKQQMAQLDRNMAAVSKALTQQMLDNLQPQPAMPKLDAAATMAAMGAALPMQGMFSDGAASDLTMDAQVDLPPPPPVTFLGESLQATRIVLAIDVSASARTKLMRAGLSLEAVREEVSKLIDQLGPDHLFGMILFTRNWLVFRDELVPATKLIKQQAHAWLQKEFRTDGSSARHWQTGNPNGIEAVLSTAFAMDARLSEIFILSDGDFYRTPLGGGGQKVPLPQLRQHTSRLQQSNHGTARLRFMAFYPPPANVHQLQQWIAENGNGRLRIIDDNPP